MYHSMSSWEKQKIVSNHHSSWLSRYCRCEYNKVVLSGLYANCKDSKSDVPVVYLAQIHQHHINTLAVKDPDQRPQISQSEI